jgi:hypothetical protein
MDFVTTEPTEGYVLCIHTCVQGGCKDSTHSTLWTKRGAPLRKHATNTFKHPSCTPSCPGYGSLNQTHGKFPYSRPATKDDFQLHTAHLDDINTITSSNVPSSSSSSTAHDIRSTSPYSHQSSIIDLDNKDEADRFHGPAHSAKPHFKILYVPDPTRVATPIRAQADLAFLKTTITSLEYQNMKHLSGSIHLVGRARNGEQVVYMQEWVCNYIYSYKNKELMIGSSVSWFDYCEQHMEQMDLIFSQSILWIGIHFLMQCLNVIKIVIHGAEWLMLIVKDSKYIYFLIYILPII